MSDSSLHKIKTEKKKVFKRGVRKKSVRTITVSAVFGVISLTCINPKVLNILALKLGAGEFYLGLLSFAFTTPFLLRLLTLRTMEIYGKKKLLSIGAVAIWTINFTFLLLPVLGYYGYYRTALALMVLMIFLRMSSHALGNVGWFPILQDIVPEKMRGRFFGNLRSWWQLAALITTLSIALMLGKSGKWWEFEFIFLAAVLTGTARMCFVRKLPDTDKAAPVIADVSLKYRFIEVFSNKKLRTYILYIITYLFALGAAEPFKIKYMRDLGYSDGFIISSMAMIPLGAILTLKLWGKFADRHGGRAIFSSSILFLAVLQILWVPVGENSSVMILLLLLGWSVFHNGNMLAQTRYLLNTVEEHKQNQINIVGIFANFFVGLGPLTAGIFLESMVKIRPDKAAEGFQHYHLLFAICSVMLVLPWMLRRGLGLEHETSAKNFAINMLRPMRMMFDTVLTFSKHDKKQPPEKDKHQQ